MWGIRTSMAGYTFVTKLNYISLQRLPNYFGRHVYTAAVISLNQENLLLKYSSLATRYKSRITTLLQNIPCNRHCAYCSFGKQLTLSKRHFHCSACIYKENEDKESEFLANSETLESSEAEYENLARQCLYFSHHGHQLFVIQPYIKWGMEKKRNTTPELQLSEAVALIDSVPKWTVVEKLIMPLKSFEKKTFFGSGNYQMLKDKIHKDRRITAVFISTRMLRGIQHRELENGFGVPVFDRYAVVMQILREHAVTREAKLQVAMAEIPYVRSRLRDMDMTTLDKQGAAAASVGGPGETYFEVQKNLLLRRETKLRGMLEKLREHRELLRNKRRKQEYPVVAVVGYTNAGKTSLIRALTGNQELRPEDKLFATLDVTVHMGKLPCSLKVLYVDTIGFISNIPTSLIESFVATLEDAMLADVILHVRDISHPDTVAQGENVMATLKSLNLTPQMLENIVVAGNKADLIGDALVGEDQDYIAVSATQHTGLDRLIKAVERAVLKSTARQFIVIRVPMGSSESRWLYKQAAVTETMPDPKDSQYLLMKVVISQAQLNKFRSYFT